LADHARHIHDQRGFPQLVAVVKARGVVNEAPPTGRFDGTHHRFPVRVYFEDTDLSGVVYHANYLRFMERARSDMLRALGLDQRGAFDAGEGVYAVADLSIKYRRPARLDDDLIVVSTVAHIGAATAAIHQAVMRGPEILTQAEVTAAFLTLDGKPRRQPKAWVAAFRRLNEET
jgi:acyl-CoA thioester hydrolase